MKELLDFTQFPKLKAIFEITRDSFVSSLSSITSQEVKLISADMSETDAKSMFAPFENETLINAGEGNSNEDLGLMFKTVDITSLSDYMMGGKGDSENELNSDLKDAIGELSSQLLSSLSVPYELECNKKFSIKVEDVAKNISASLFTRDQYYVMDIVVTVENKEINFIFYFSDGLVNYITLEESSDVGASGSEQFISSSSNNVNVALASNQNLDLLLDIDIPISVRMGTARLFLKDILGLGPGNIVELEQSADDSIELTVNDKVVARGEVVIVDGYFGFRIKEIISRAERIRKLKD